jgi:hypothetical protein
VERDLRHHLEQGVVVALFVGDGGERMAVGSSHESNIRQMWPDRYFRSTVIRVAHEQGRMRTTGPPDAIHCDVMHARVLRQ